MSADAKKPRVRKVETVRERNEKAALKAESAAQKSGRRPVRRTLGGITKPLGVIAKPLNVRPVRFVLRWIGLILFPRYFRNSFKELRQVTWPGRKETWKLTFAVLVFAVVFSLFIGVVDFGLDKVIRRIVLR